MQGGDTIIQIKLLKVGQTQNRSEARFTYNHIFSISVKLKRQKDKAEYAIT